jgi:Leucine-rich repeat (LRR) protein
LPLGIEELDKLEYMDVSSNQLKTIPSSYEKLFYYSKQFIYRNGRSYSSRTFFESRINLGGNPDLEIDPKMAAEDPGNTRNFLLAKEERGKRFLSLL